MSDFKVTGTGTFSEMMGQETQPEVANETSEATVESTETSTTQTATETTEQQPQTTEQVVTPVTEQTAPAPVQMSWEEVLSNNGFDSKDIELLKYRKEHGNVIPYLEATSKDYTKMSPEEIMRHDLRSQWKDLTDDEFDLLYREQIVDRYKLDRESYSETDPEAKLGLAKLRRDSDEARKRLIDEQQKFYLPANKAEDQTARIAAEQQAQQELQQFQSYVNNHPETKALLANKRLVIGEGEEAFNYSVDPNKLLEQVFDPQGKFWTKFSTPDGGFDFNKLFKVLAYSDDIDGIEKARAAHIRSLATKEIIEDELQNVAPAGSTPPAATGENMWEAFRNRGNHKTYGG